MRNKDNLTIDKVLPQMRGGNVRQVLAGLAMAASQVTGVNAHLIQTALWAQEAQESSGIGSGVALAQMKMRGLAQPCVIFGRLSRAVDFAAVDGWPVDLALLLLSPEADGPVHLQRLARLTRMMRDETLLRQLRGTADSDILHSLLSDPQSRKLAA